MSVKAVNDIAGLDRLTPTLLIFRAYLRLSTTDTPTTLITKRAAVIKLAIADVRKCYTVRKVLEAL